MRVVLSHGRWIPRKQAYALGPHRNPGLELVYVIRGDVTWDYDGVPVPSPAHSITYTWPWQEHGSATRSVPPTELVWLIFPLDRAHHRAPRRFDLHPVLGFSATESAAIITHLRRGYGRAIPAGPLLRQLIPLLQTELAAPGPLAPARILSMSRLVLVELARAALAAPAQPQHPDSPTRPRQFLVELQARCHEPWTLATMAAACGLKRTQFTRVVEELAGDSPFRLLTRLRIERAEKLLRETDTPVTAIAMACGFATSQYFASVFRAYRHRSPSAWRRAAR